MDHPPIPPHPAHLPDWASDELPLLTETVGEPVIPLLREALPDPARANAPADDVSLLAEPLPAELPLAPPAASVPPLAPRPAASATAGMPLAQIERELQAAAELIMQEVIDDYMLQIEAELHRRLEEHLAKVLRAGRR